MKTISIGLQAAWIFSAPFAVLLGDSERLPHPVWPLEFFSTCPLKEIPSCIVEKQLLFWSFFLCLFHAGQTTSRLRLSSSAIKGSRHLGFRLIAVQRSSLQVPVDSLPPSLDSCMFLWSSLQPCCCFPFAHSDHCADHDWSSWVLRKHNNKQKYPFSREGRREVSNDAGRKWWILTEITSNLSLSLQTEQEG